MKYSRWAGAALALVLVAGAVARPAEAAQRGGLQEALDAVHSAGMPGVYASVRERDATWTGASGVADVRSGRPVRPAFEHRIGSITKTFTATAVLQQVAAGRVDLDAPIGRYLPRVVPGERGRKITVRMLLSHTSGINDYDHVIFASVFDGSLADVESNRWRRWTPQELIHIGLTQPPLPRGEFSYANTNYVIAGLLVEAVTGESLKSYVARNVIRRAGLRHTYFPSTPFIRGPHSKGYDTLNGRVDPPGEFSVYSPTSEYGAGDIVSTMGDLTVFYRALLGGRLIPARRLAEMKRTVEPGYGLGLYKVDLGCGTFWGHDGLVPGMSTLAFSSEDGRRQFAVGVNETNYQRLGPDGQPVPHKIDAALDAFMAKAACGAGAGSSSGRSFRAESGRPVLAAAG